MLLSGLTIEEQTIFDWEPAAELLLKNGAKVTSRNKHGESPLSEVVRHGSIKALIKLLDNLHDEDVDSIDSKGNSALSLAAKYGKYAIVWLLLRAGASTQQYNSQGKIPLAIAAEAGHSAIVKLLIQNNANVDGRDAGIWRQQIPLVYAAQRGQQEVVQVLLDNGADIGLMDSSNRTALCWAKENGHVTVASLLEDRSRMAVLEEEEDFASESVSSRLQLEMYPNADADMTSRL